MNHHVGMELLNHLWVPGFAGAKNQPIEMLGEDRQQNSLGERVMEEDRARQFRVARAPDLRLNVPRRPELIVERHYPIDAMGV